MAANITSQGSRLESGRRMVLNAFSQIPIGAISEAAGEGVNVPFTSKVDANTGEVVWKTYMMDEAQPRGLNAEGVQQYGPSGAGIWSAPTLDVERGLL